MKRDQLVFNLIKQEENRQKNGIELIASENFVSPQVLEAMGSCLTNKYAEGYPGHRYYGGCEIVDQTEQLAIDRLKELYDAEYVNLSHGGHLSHGSPVNLSGILYRPVAYGVKKDTGTVDYDMMEELALNEKPRLIMGGASAYSREWDYARMREIADKVGAILVVDMAHPAGIIAAGLLDNPLKYAHIVTSTTHKTLRGPRGGIILVGKDFENPWGKTTRKGVVRKMSSLLNSGVFPGTQGGPLEHVIAAKAVAFGEALQPEFREYQKQVVKNARKMAAEFIERGYQVVSGGTDNHSMLIDLRTKYPEITGKQVEDALVQADITVNKNMVPFDSRPPLHTSGLRLGTPAVTTRGMKENDMVTIVDLIDRVIQNYQDEDLIRSVKKEVNEMMAGYPLFAG